MRKPFNQRYASRAEYEALHSMVSFLEDAWLRALDDFDQLRGEKFRAVIESLAIGFMAGCVALTLLVRLLAWAK